MDRARDAAGNEVVDLVRRSKTGCAESFGELAGLFEQRVFNYLLKCTSNHHDAEDLTQVAFLKAYRNLQQFDPKHSFAGWLFTIARRTALNHFRSSRSYEPIDEVEVMETRDPSVLAGSREEQASIWRVARRLKPRLFEVLWLRYGEDFSIQETARIMVISQIHARVLLHRARTQLARLLKDESRGRG